MHPIDFTDKIGGKAHAIPALKAHILDSIRFLKHYVYPNGRTQRIKIRWL
jgi:hypothetical protein